jgi:ABC-2 type transport system permease protein
LDDFLRDRFMLVLFVFLAFIMVISVGVSSADFRSKIADYNQYVSALKAAGSAFPPQPQLFPLQLLRGSIEYLELIGALFAVIIGYGMVAKEKYRGTLQLLFSRPISPSTLAAGKVTALALLWLVTVIGVFVIITASLIVIGNAPLHGVDIGRLAITAGLAWVYLLFWSCLAMGVAALAKNLSTALIVTLAIWLVFVLILPQIGDTMDPDNQVPGGLFKSLQVDKAHEKAVTAHFTGYESARNYLEVVSVTKQFERPAFAILGTNASYNQKSIKFVALRLWPNVLSLVLSTIAAVYFAVRMTTKQRLLRKE